MSNYIPTIVESASDAELNLMLQAAGLMAKGKVDILLNLNTTVFSFAGLFLHRAVLEEIEKRKFIAEKDAEVTRFVDKEAVENLTTLRQFIE